MGSLFDSGKSWAWTGGREEAVFVWTPVCSWFCQELVFCFLFHWQVSFRVLSRQVGLSWLFTDSINLLTCWRFFTIYADLCGNEDKLIMLWATFSLGLANTVWCRDQISTVDVSSPAVVCGSLTSKGFTFNGLNWSGLLFLVHWVSCWNMFSGQISARDLLTSRFEWQWRSHLFSQRSSEQSSSLQQQPVLYTGRVPVCPPLQLQTDPGNTNRMKQQKTTSTVVCLCTEDWLTNLPGGEDNGGQLWAIPPLCQEGEGQGLDEDGGN